MNTSLYNKKAALYVQYIVIYLDLVHTFYLTSWGRNFGGYENRFITVPIYILDPYTCLYFVESSFLVIKSLRRSVVKPNIVQLDFHLIFILNFLCRILEYYAQVSDAPLTDEEIDLLLTKLTRSGNCHNLILPSLFNSFDKLV